MLERPAFVANPLDRASDRRIDASWVEARLADPQSRFLPLHELDVLVRVGPEPCLAWATDAVRAFERETTGAVLLGLLDGVAHFAVDISPTPRPEAALGVEGAARFTEIRALAAALSPEEAGIVAQARALLDWHAHHAFCSSCGEATRPAQAGALRRCPDCGAEHFPRVNPVVIMTVVRGERCLLGRQKGWPPGMYSALAGFVEVGETLEDAVRREVFEETGVHVGDVRYLASQPWPFPSSLMLGCTCEARTEQISVDPAELQDARWFERSQVRKALEAPSPADGFFVPPAMSIAHHLLRAWVAEGPDRPS